MSTRQLWIYFFFLSLILLGVGLLPIAFAQTERATIPVPIKISWDYKGVPTTMKIYEVSTKKPVSLWDTGNGASLEDLPAGAEIPDSILRPKPGEKKQFALVLKNLTAEKIHFFAAPHVVNPPEFSLGFKFQCLCINHVYSVEPGQYWYRIVELNMYPEYVGNGFDITHSLIRVDESRSHIKPVKDHHGSHEM